MFTFSSMYVRKRWDMLTKNVASPRTEIPLSSSHGPAGWTGGMDHTGPCIVPGRTFDRCSQGSLISGPWKLYYGPGGTASNESCNFCWWDGKNYPNKSVPFNKKDDPFNCPKGEFKCRNDMPNECVQHVVKNSFS